jgi:sugar fermentation stimulation protein A
MKTCIVEGGTVWLSRAQNPNRKLRFTWELAEIDGRRVYVNPSGANQLTLEGLKQRRIPALAGYDLVSREVPYGVSSRIDLLLTGPRRCYVEVKNVTMDGGDSRGAFPDSVTDRGRKHLHELIAVAARGDRAVMFFCASREGTLAVVPADVIDPQYGKALRLAQAQGVELLAHQVCFGERALSLGQEIPVLLPS